MDEKFYAEYRSQFGGDMTWAEGVEKVNSMKTSKAYVDYCRCFLNDYIDYVTIGYDSYGTDDNRFEDKDFDAICTLAMSIEKDASYYPALAFFFKGDYEKCFARLKRKDLFGTIKDSFDDISFVNIFLRPFKNAFPGFWSRLAGVLKGHKLSDKIVGMCEVFNDYYNAKNNTERIEVLERAVSQNSDIAIYQELLGIAYYNEKLYNSALSYLERIADNYDSISHMYYLDQLYFYMGYAYSKVKDHGSAIESYEKAYEINPNAEWVCNNLGYEYYLIKQYDKALEWLQICLDNKRDFPYAPNNYARTLCVMGRIEEAKQFVKDAPVKIYKDIVDRINKATSKKKASKTVIAAPEMDEENGLGEDSGKGKYRTGKEEQFSNEKLLEDELENRILQGYEVFGKKLKMYKRRGEYGRQYIIPNRRIDLLAEDDKGNFYVIELKKDSGYDDPYEQIIEYLDYIQKNKAPKGKKVSGIICLNSPSDALIKKVKADDRVELYEYVISYNKV